MDLLNLNSAPAVASTIKQSPSTNFDLLSGFGDANTNATSTDNFGSFNVGPSQNAGAAKSDDLFDPFGTTGEGDGNLLGGWGNFNSTATSTSASSAGIQQNQNATKPPDLFADLGNLGSGFNMGQYLIK